jgi:hypothetical protein
MRGVGHSDGADGNGQQHRISVGSRHRQGLLASPLIQQPEAGGGGRVAEFEGLPVPNRRGGRIRLNAARPDLRQDAWIIGLGYTDRTAGVAC